MKHTFVWLMALAMCATLTTTKLSAQGSQMTKDQQDVLAAVQTMTAAFMNKDINTVMASYENAATVVFEPGKPVSDRAALNEMFTGMSGVNPVFSYSGHDVIVNGDIGIHIAPWEMEGTMPDGTKISQSGLSVAVLRRQVDGSWLMVIDHPHAQTLLNAAN